MANAEQVVEEIIDCRLEGPTENVGPLQDVLVFALEAPRCWAASRPCRWTGSAHRKRALGSPRGDENVCVQHISRIDKRITDCSALSEPHPALFDCVSCAVFTTYGATLPRPKQG